MRRWTSVAWACSPGSAPTSLWGLFPLYFPLLEPAGGLEIVAHRVRLVAAVRRPAADRRAGAGRRCGPLVADRRRLLVLAGAALLIAVNWLVFVYGVNSGHVVETSLGYFINPLVSVLLGVVVFSERLRPAAVGGGRASPRVAVAVLTVDYGRPPWIALALAASFGLYGLMKKLVRVEAAPGLFVETALVARAGRWSSSASCTPAGTATFGNAGAGNALLLVSSGRGHRDPAAAVRRRRPADPAVDRRACCST